MKTPTVSTLSAGSVNMVLMAARLKGLDTDTLLAASGIRSEQLANPDGRVPIVQMQQLWQQIAAQTDASALALQMGELINPVAVGTVAYVMMHSPTLEAAIRQLCRYQKIACDGSLTTLRPEGAHRALIITLTSPDIRYPQYVYDSELAIYLAAFRALTGMPVAAGEIRFAYPKPASVKAYQTAFGSARLVFNAGETAMILSEKWLKTPVLNATPSLMLLFEQHADRLLAELTAYTLSERVKAELIALMKGHEPTLAAIADRLAMGVRTLQLHLKAEGTTYQQVLDEVRRELAQAHLRQPHLSTTDVAYLLGYTDASVFFRSFRKWTGQTPGTYRNQYVSA